MGQSQSSLNGTKSVTFSGIPDVQSKPMMKQEKTGGVEIVLSSMTAKLLVALLAIMIFTLIYLLARK